MNSNKPYQTNLSREDIELYRSTTDEAVKHQIEKNSLENDFDADALEGWSMPSTTPLNMKRLDKKFKPSSKLYIWGTAILVVGIITSIVLFNNKKTVDNQKTILTAESSSIKVEQTDVVTPAKIEAMQELPKKQQITIQTIVKDFTIQKTEEKNTEKAEVIDNLPITKIEEAEKETALIKETTLGKEIYLYDMKLLDYRAYRSKPKITTKQMVLTGTPANVGETTELEEATEWKNVDIPYIEYVSKTMELFSKGQNKKALSRFQVILETYPDDVNANFYAGLCYYNLKEFTSAVSAFNQCIDSKYTNFNEEAEWYAAKSLLADGKKSEASTLFQKIITANGYYAAQAKKIVANL
jgi:TolA-binding protein